MPQFTFKKMAAHRWIYVLKTHYRKLKTLCGHRKFLSKKHEEKKGYSFKSNLILEIDCKKGK